ncbi:MAG: hypothetical protein ACO1OB_05140 [Archangium sp.]
MSTPTVPFGEHAEDKYIDIKLLEYLQTLTMAERVGRHEVLRALLVGLRESGLRHFKREIDDDAMNW